MWYSYYVGDNGVVKAGKTFETLEAFTKYAAKNPDANMTASNKEPDLLGRAYSANPNFAN